MTETREKSVAETFAFELRSFFALCLLSLVFGALALAFGLQFIVTAILGMATTGDFGILPFLQALIGWAGAVIGFRWILSSAGILKGVNRIRREYTALGKPVSGEAITGLIIRMMAHYRENWKTIWRMNLISTVGGAIFLALGLANLLQGITGLTGAANISALLPFLAAAINLTIGLVCLFLSSWFRRYARAWELRLIEASRWEENLKQSMEQG
ncbi:MAG: hypothetical protein LUQ67_03615 [Methanomicrobiales archaeon]|nr:hypothetical protein [Methanomicrobiales archaeon]